MFNRELFNQIISLAGPLGPLGSEEDVSKIRHKITRGHPLTTAIDLINIIRIAPTVPKFVSWDDVEWEIVELLGMLAEDDEVRNFLLSSLFTSSKARSVILNSLALLFSPQLGPTLARLAFELSNEDNVSDKELIALASALGSSGGPEALSALNAMREMTQFSKKVKNEINIALSMLKNQEIK